MRVPMRLLPLLIVAGCGEAITGKPALGGTFTFRYDP
jgi:hypothetical protein